MTYGILTADSLSRSFGRKRVLEDISLSVGEGSVCSLLGPNGAGKTTLLKLFVGMIEPTAGLAGIAGDFHLPRRAETLQWTGCLLDGLEPPPSTRIDQLVALSREMSAAFDDARAKELLSQKKLAPAAVWKTLSKGQKRWTLLSLLLARRCRVLLLDEPADGLDPQSRIELYQLIRREANDRNVATLITTHIINDIEKVTDDVVILNDRRLQLCGDLEDLREQTLVLETEESVFLPSQIQILKRETGRRHRYVLRDVDGRLPAEIPGEMLRRNASLEEIYLAVTSDPQPAAPPNSLTEIGIS